MRFGGMIARITAIAVTVGWTGGCSSVGIAGEGLQNEPTDPSASPLSASIDTGPCGLSIPKLGDFILAMPSCCEGLGRCVPPSPLVPSSASSLLSSCDGGGSCVPESILRSAERPLTKCTSMGGEPGACVATCISLVKKLQSLLPQDVCAPNERCTPCVSPVDGKPTGLCELGTKPPTPRPATCPAEAGPKLTCPHQGPPVLDVAKLRPCADGMHCMPKLAVPKSFDGMLDACEGDPDSVCAPDKAIAANGQYVAPTCKSVGGAEGRCLNAKIPQVASQNQFLPKDICDANELCAPCFDPVSGDALPSCSIACDSPKEAAKKFAECGGGKGRCAPKSAAGAMAANLKQDTCAASEVCAPLSAIDRRVTPKTCQSTSMIPILNIPIGKGPGVCLEDVTSLGAALVQDSCAAGFKCTPCVNPLDNKPTGLAGCPK